MLSIPAVGAAIVIRERRLMALEGRVAAAHDSLPQVVEAVDHVPVVVGRQRDVGLEAGVRLHDGVLHGAS